MNKEFKILISDHDQTFEAVIFDDNSMEIAATPKMEKMDSAMERLVYIKGMLNFMRNNDIKKVEMIHE